MRFLLVFLLPLLLAAQSDRDLSGTWKFNAAESSLHDAALAANPVLTITQSATAVSVQQSGITLNYPLNGKSLRNPAGDSTINIVTKWEGTSLLANVIVSGKQDYSVRERWTRSSNGNRLTIEKTVSRANSETESTLVYDNPAAVLTSGNPQIPAHDADTPAAGPVRTVASPASLIVPAGTRVLLRLTNAVSTKHTAVGDRLYLETAVPVFINGKLAIPVRSYVTATVLESERAGRVKGKSGLNFRFDTLTLPNGVTRDFHNRAGSVDTAGSLDRTEGRISGESNKGGDTGKVAKTTTTGAGIGSIAGAATGHLGMGAGIGAAAGALGGLAGVLASRGADVVLPAGTSMEMVLDRDLEFTAEDMRRVN